MDAVDFIWNSVEIKERQRLEAHMDSIMEAISNEMNRHEEVVKEILMDGFKKIKNNGKNADVDKYNSLNIMRESMKKQEGRSMMLMGFITMILIIFMLTMVLHHWH